MGQNFTRSFDRLLILSPRYGMVTCLTLGVGAGRKGFGRKVVCEAKLLAEGRGRSEGSGVL